ncbi:MAG: hypothetical protein RSB35_09490, partial [Eubacterium sp.]
MVKLYENGVFLVNGTDIVEDAQAALAATGKEMTVEEARKGTIAYSILEAHNTSDNMEALKVKFDA